jgi:Kef-type K+ transport system membrane component KefB
MTHDVSTTAPSHPGWRFRLGVSLFGLGLVCPVFVPLVAATGLSTEWKTILSGLFMLGIPEILWVVAVAVMGKAGFDHIKARVFGFLKRHAVPRTVSRTRYRIGLALLLLPILFAWLAPYAPGAIPGYESHRLAANLAGDLLLLASLFVLGGDFWDKLRALFVYEAKVRVSAA